MQWVFYPIVGEGVISFPENTKIESFNEFLRAIRAVNNDYKAIIVVLDNFSTHVEFIWKDIKGPSRLFSWKM